jgi:hypothetical protein
MVTAALKESSNVVLSISAFTSNAVTAALLNELDGLPREPSTVEDETLFICITTDDGLETKLAGVCTESTRPESDRDVVAEEFVATLAEVEAEGTAPPAHPVVVKLLASEVLELLAASVEYTL